SPCAARGLSHCAYGRGSKQPWCLPRGSRCTRGGPLCPLRGWPRRSHLGGAKRSDDASRTVRLIRHATSLGAVESTMERRAAIPGQEHLPPSLLRLSVGIEDADDLWADLDSAVRSIVP